MSQSLSVGDKLFQSSQSILLLEQIAQTQSKGYFNAYSSGINWTFAIHQNRLIYATHSIDPWDRIQRHLRRISHEAPRLTREICSQIRLTVENTPSPTDNTPLEYLAILWLVQGGYLSLDQAYLLVERMTEEVLESYLLVPQVLSSQFVPAPFPHPIYCQRELPETIERSRQRLQQWTPYLPLVWSPFQRPYFFTNRYSEEKLSLAQRQKLSQTLKGFSLRHLSALLNSDELMLVKRLYPLIQNKAIILREPPPPFDRLPPISTDMAVFIPNPPAQEAEDLSFSSFPHPGTASKTWKIVCVDDSPTMLQEINRFLDDKNLSVTTINDSLKALMQILRIKPDLILMDVGMPNVDGYKLCSMLRKSPLLKSTPIIMVTGKTGIIDRAKARMMGATDYMTKPFTQSELLQIVFRYLTE